MDDGDRAADFGSLLRPAEVAALVPAAGSSPETRGAGAPRVLGRPGWSGGVGEGAGNPMARAKSRYGHQRVAAHGETARRRRHPTPTRNQAQQRAREGKGEGMGGSLPQGVPQEPLGGGEGVTMARVNGGGTGTAWRSAGERGQRKSGREWRNWSVSQVADVEAELTVAEGTTGLRLRRGNELGTAADNGGSSLACTQRGGLK
jgi:hypothetical protein